MEYNERSLFMRDFYCLLEDIDPKNKNIIVKATYLQNYLKLPSIFKKTHKEIFSGDINFIIEHHACGKCPSFTNMYYKTLILLKKLKGSKDIKTNCGNYYLNELFKTENNGLGLEFINCDKKYLPLFVNLSHDENVKADKICQVSKFNISVEGGTTFDVMCGDNKEYLLNDDQFHDEPIVNHGGLEHDERKVILLDFLHGVMKLSELVINKTKIVSDKQKIPEVKMEKKLACPITHFKAPFLDIKLKCKCFGKKGRFVSIMAVLGIVNSISDSNAGLCPYCKDPLKFSFKANKPDRIKLLDLNIDELKCVKKKKEKKNNATDKKFDKQAVEFINGILENDNESTDDMDDMDDIDDSEVDEV